MPVPELNLIGIDPGQTTGWAWIQVPRAAFYKDAPSQILNWETGEFTGDENQQVLDICKLAVQKQGLSWKVGTALVVEDFDNDSPVRDKVVFSPVRIAAKLDFAVACEWAGDARMVLQGRAMAKSTATDDRLKAWGLYEAGSDHRRDAMRHAIVALRRARSKPAFRDELWFPV